ncbi:SnoaL-like domain protein [Croceibacterium atlanticum]|uniref:SnoaL-like domain protein n=1 Tax=Croceibacterium atlanticum TaxID=1267766 RepID=A0A0F7KPR7_9SPHN|nr:nuclear transport factor 2 family protein [Croceibacterium atlanticum]AKH42518.1 SnoaL-like domain protein [Croceibacterium atlanticum]
MKITRFALAAIIATALQSAPLAAQEEVTVQDLADRWTAAYNQADVDAIAALYGPNAELYIHNEGRYVGRDSIRDYWLGDVNRSNPITVLNVTDSVRDSEMMLVHGNYQVLDRTNGVPLGAGRFAHIWILGEDGAWHLDRDVWVDRNAR